MKPKALLFAGVTTLLLAAGCDDDGGSNLSFDAAGGSGGAGADGSVRSDASDRRDGSPAMDAPVADASSGADAAHEDHDAAAPLPGVDAGVVACDYGSAGSAATTDNLNLFGQVVYLNGGQALPPGRYVATFVDGCFKYNGGQGWTVHAYAANAAQPLGWYLVGATTADRVARLPGTVGWAAGAGAYADFEACVTANKQLGSVEFDYAGGKLGVWLLDDNYPDNVVGRDGRNPKWRIVKLGACP